MVWKSTSSVGYGISFGEILSSSSGNDDYYYFFAVANYAPPGNIENEFSQNVSL